MSDWYFLASKYKNIPEIERKNIYSIVQKITNGNNIWTPEELELRCNNAELVEELLTLIAKRYTI